MWVTQLNSIEKDGVKLFKQASVRHLLHNVDKIWKQACSAGLCTSESCLACQHQETLV